jgi:hypothetical protein
MLPAGNVGLFMFTRIRSVLRARRAAMLEAEAFVVRYGSRCAAAAGALARDPLADDRRRAHYRRVARLAVRKYDLYCGLDRHCIPRKQSGGTVAGRSSDEGENLGSPEWLAA